MNKSCLLQIWDMNNYLMTRQNAGTGTLTPRSYILTSAGKQSASTKLTYHKGEQLMIIGHMMCLKAACFTCFHSCGGSPVVFYATETPFALGPSMQSDASSIWGSAERISGPVALPGSWQRRPGLSLHT